MAAPDILVFSAKVHLRSSMPYRQTDPIITVIITCMRYKVPTGIIRAPKLIASPSAANRETRSDSHSRSIGRCIPCAGVRFATDAIAHTQAS